MELGSPPFYAEANRVAKDDDQKYLKEFGPYLKALTEVIQWGEMNKQKCDRIMTGKMIGEVEDNMTGVFLLWKSTIVEI